MSKQSEVFDLIEQLREVAQRELGLVDIPLQRQPDYLTRVLNNFEPDRYFDLGTKHQIVDILLRLHNAEARERETVDHITSLLERINRLYGSQYEGQSIWNVMDDILGRIEDQRQQPVLPAEPAEKVIKDAYDAGYQNGFNNALVANGVK
ncbi:MAG: hypothetical protein ACYDCO_01820 [Armatimonadota bacterium]